MDRLPSEIFTVIFTYLPVNQLIHIYCTCKTFSKIMNNFDWDNYFKYKINRTINNIIVNKDFMITHGAFLLNNDSNDINIIRYLSCYNKLFDAIEYVLTSRISCISWKTIISFEIITHKCVYYICSSGIFILCYKNSHMYKSEMIIAHQSNITVDEFQLRDWPKLFLSLKRTLLHFLPQSINVMNRSFDKDEEIVFNWVN